jgi:hypothetical protein
MYQLHGTENGTGNRAESRPQVLTYEGASGELRYFNQQFRVRGVPVSMKVYGENKVDFL